MFVRDEFGLWITTVLVAASPLIVASIVLYIRADDGEAWWKKFDDVFAEGDLLLVTATIIATALASSSSSIFSTMAGRVAVIFSVVLIVIASGVWSSTRFDERETIASGTTSQMEEDAQAGSGGSEGNRVAEVSLFLFAGSLLLGSGLVWLSSTEAAAADSEAKMLRDFLIDLTKEESQTQNNRPKVKGDQAPEG